MSTFRVEILPVEKVEKHPNADRLDLITIRGWQCIVGRGEFKEGDAVLYFPIDSVLSPGIESLIFPPDSKVKLTRGRVRTIKLRGAISQGLAVRPELVDPNGLFWGRTGHMIEIGVNFADLLGVTKYEPPQPLSPQSNVNQMSTRTTNPHFRKYTEIENFKWYPDLFQDGEMVIVTEKIHGTNFRCGWVPWHPTTRWKKILKFLHLAPQWEFVYGSHNVQLQDRRGIGVDVYWEAIEKYDLKEKLGRHKGVVLYGEIYGDGIQKGYTYGCAKGERNLVVFDAGVCSPVLDLLPSPYYMDWEQFVGLTDLFDLPLPPVVFSGPYKADGVRGLSHGVSDLGPQPFKEGVVIRPAREQATYMGRKILKLINDDYLLWKNAQKEEEDTEWH